MCKFQTEGSQGYPLPIFVLSFPCQEILQFASRLRPQAGSRECTNVQKNFMHLWIVWSGYCLRYTDNILSKCAVIHESDNIYT